MALNATTLPSARWISSAGSPDAGSVKDAALFAGNEAIFARAEDEEAAGVGVMGGAAGVAVATVAVDCPPDAAFVGVPAPFP
jgi:hypothetical protein